MTRTPRTLAPPALAALVLTGACTNSTGVAPDPALTDAPDPAAVVAPAPPTASAASTPGARAARVRSWGGHTPAEYTGLVAVRTPDEHPGIPLYARLGYPAGFPEGQIIEADDRVIVVFYREISCIPEDFNLLDFFHFPGPDGPGAYQCAPYHTGTLYTEPDASPMDFPRIIDLEGTAVPLWMVDAAQLHAAAADGSLTLPELAALDRIERVAGAYDEHLHARNADHFIGIDAKHDRAAPGFRFRLDFEGVVTSQAERVQLVLR